MSWMTLRDQKNNRAKRFLDTWLDEGFPLNESRLESILADKDISSFNPKIDVHEHEGVINLKAELPGVKKEDVEVSVDHNLVSIKGHKKKEEKLKEKDYRYYECAYGSFQRTVQLPYEVDMEKIKAEFDNGVLEVHLEKEPELKQKSRKISF